MILGDTRADSPHARHHGRKVDRTIGRRRAEVRAVAYECENSRGSDDRLGGNGARIQGVAAEVVALNESHASALTPGELGRGQARGATAYNDQVVKLLGFRVLPVGRAHPAQIVLLIHGHATAIHLRSLRPSTPRGSPDT